MPETKCLTARLQSLQSCPQRLLTICGSWNILRISFSPRKLFMHLSASSGGSQRPQSPSVVSQCITLRTPTARLHCVELAGGLHPDKEEVKKEPEKWPREGASNLPRLVGAGVFPGDGEGTEQPAREEKEDASDDNQRPGEAGWL